VAPDTSAEARAAIDANNAHWAHFTGAGQAESLAQFFHANAVLLPPNMPVVRGGDSIRAFFAYMNAISTPPATLTIRADSVWAQGTHAVEMGRWVYAVPAGATRAPGMPMVDSGKYLVRWVKDGDRWLMVQDMWNSSMPLPQPSP
jgi:ketosteroid isomerase-like protein